MQKFKWFLLVIVVSATSLSFIAPAREKINWVNINDLDALYKENPKPILVDLYTGWCGWCKVMDKNTYGNKKVAEYINEHYYAVKFDAESTKDVVFNGKTFKYNTEYKAHELALQLTFGRLEFPHTIFLSNPSARPAPLSGYMKPAEIEAPLKFFGSRADSLQTFVEFEKKLKKEW